MSSAVFIGAMALTNSAVLELLHRVVPKLVCDSSSQSKRVVVELRHNKLKFMGDRNVVLLFDEWDGAGVTMQVITPADRWPDVVTLATEDDFVLNVLDKMTHVLSSGRRHPKCKK